MTQDITVPSMGESVTEAIIAEWLKPHGGWVNRNEPLLVLESDKANFEIVADAAGAVSHGAAEGDTVEVGAVVGTIDESATAPASDAPVTAEPASPSLNPNPSSNLNVKMGPAVRKLVEEHGLDPSTIVATGKGGRLLKEDVLAHLNSTPSVTPEVAAGPAPAASVDKPTVNAPVREVRREKMTTLRRRIAERLVMSQQTTATLTTFNEIDMSSILALRVQYKEAFKEKHEVSLGFMGLFTKAVCEAMTFVPEVGASIDGGDLVYPGGCHVGVAVGTPKGLVVPVVRDADLMSVAQIEQSIRHFALKARDGKIAIDDMQGGSFTISNGGVYGSLMSTPILNPPQSGILGMHKIEERPIAVNGEVVIRPMMYVALSYDHRVIDGAGAVTFLVKIKEFIEDPARLLLGI